MGILKFGEFVNENYPWGAANDPSAPWNQEDPDVEYDIDFEDGGVVLIERVYSSRKPDEEDWEDNKTYIDPVYMDKFIADKLNLNIDEHEDGIEVIDISEPNDGQYVIHTPHGEIETNWSELENIASGN